MYIAYYPTPQMLPTVTLNPTVTATGATAATGSPKRKRDVSEPLPYDRPIPPRSTTLSADRWWWFGMGATILGGVAYYAF